MKYITTIFLLIWIAAASPAYAQIDDPAWFKKELEKYRKQMKLPALAASIVFNGKVVAASAVGVRKYGHPIKARVDDRFHIGSIAKTLTGTLAGKMIELGKISQDQTIGSMFPELKDKMQPAYENVTVTQLLRHMSGMPYAPLTPEHETDKYGTTAPMKRYGYVIAALKDKPEAVPGTKHIYGGGHILVAQHIERRMKTSYEVLMKKYLFKPLWMSSARFGSPATANSIDGPWEHVIENDQTKHRPPDASQTIQARSPVGRNLTMSIIDIGRFAALHLKGARSESDFLKPETFRFLHQPDEIARHQTATWATGNPGWAKGRVLWHGGSTLQNLAKCHIVPDENLALCLATNIWYKGIDSPFDQMNIDIVKMIQQGKFNP